MIRKKPKERFVYILDYMKEGNPLDKHKHHKNRPVIQLLGEDYFMLMEGMPLVNIDLQLEQKIDLQSEESQILKIEFIIPYDDLTAMAKDTLNKLLNRIVVEKEKLFIEFFNKAEPLTLKLHALELLPNIGKKTLRLILEERKKKPFSSFKELEERIGIRNVTQIIVERLLRELEGNEKYYLFVYPYEFEKKQGEAIYVGYLEKLRGLIKDSDSIF